jgi:hypothetical protein
MMVVCPVHSTPIACGAGNLAPGRFTLAGGFSLERIAASIVSR